MRSQTRRLDCRWPAIYSSVIVVKRLSASHGSVTLTMSYVKVKLSFRRREKMLLFATPGRSVIDSLYPTGLTGAGRKMRGEVNER